LLYVCSLANACYKPKLAMIREQGKSLKFYFLLKLQSYKHVAAALQNDLYWYLNTIRK